MRVLCTCLPEYGHFHPMVPLARALAEAGHDVAFATGTDVCARVEAAGFPAFPAGLSLGDQLAEARRRYPREHALPAGPERFEAFVPRMLAGVAAPARMADLVPVVRRWRPDLIVHDETELAGALAAAAAGVPAAAHSIGILRPAAMRELAGRTLAPLARQWGVDTGRHAGLLDALYLDICPPSLQAPDIADVDVAHPLRPVVFDAVGEEDVHADVLLDTLPDGPTVYVTLGTVFNRADAVFAAVLAGLRDQACAVVVTVGADGDPAALGPQPDHVRVARYLPHSRVLPRCDAVVTHGGSSILGMLGFGLPLLLVPQGANQFHNAAACVAAGVGRRLLADELSPGAVGDGVRALLADAAYRHRARAVAAEIAAMPAPADVVALLETKQSR